jgi:CelD/BcsL family acetyltransferase involved in cellulose biosynthesis
LRNIHVLDPLADSRWDDLLARHPRASVFHSRGWLEALTRTFGYEPIVLTTTAQGSLENGLALCRVKTWTSRRLVSLPFSDHCEPLVDRPDDLSLMIGFLAEEMARERWRSLELRPRHVVPTGLAAGADYNLHTLALARPADEIFKGFHPSCTRRAIRRAVREGVHYEAGASGQLLATFYGLLRLTRRRHALPPPPFAWFRNLAACLGDGLAVHVASKDGLPIAGILTLTFKKTVVYKYGGSDARYHRLGGMPFLFWRVIQETKAQGIEELDLGRSDLDQAGLVAFKDHLGAAQMRLTYYTRPERRAGAAHDGGFVRMARKIVRHLPDAALDFTGRVLYRHLG